MEKFIPYEKLSKKEKRKIDQAKRQTWGELNPVTRKPENSKAYNRNKARNWKREYHGSSSSGIFLPVPLNPCYNDQKTRRDSMATDKLGRSLIFRGFRKKLNEHLGDEVANAIWQSANVNFMELERQHPDITGDSRMMVLPSAALYLALQEQAPEQVDLLKEYGTETGEKIARIIHRVTSIPGVPQLLWKNMPALMRKTSSPKLGIVSETSELVGVDILSCPLHDAAVKIGVPEAALMVCAMDKAYMTGFKHIRYTRTTSVAEGDECCDYRLSYDKNKL